MRLCLQCGRVPPSARRAGAGAGGLQGGRWQASCPRTRTAPLPGAEPRRRGAGGLCSGGGSAPHRPSRKKRAGKARVGLWRRHFFGGKLGGVSRAAETLLCPACARPPLQRPWRGWPVGDPGPALSRGAGAGSGLASLTRKGIPPGGIGHACSLHLLGTGITPTGFSHVIL